MTESQATEAQAAEGQGQEPSEATQEAQAATSENSDERDRQIAALRQEAAKYRTERNRLAAEKEERENAEKSEVEKAQGELQKRDERIASLEGRLKRASFIEQFGANGRLAWAMANDLGLDVEFDEDLKATNVDAVRKELRKQEPAHFGDGPADAGQKTPASVGYQGPPGVNRLAHAYNQNSRR